MMTDHMNCGFCCTRHPIERMGEHGWGKCGLTKDNTVTYGAQWVLEHWNRTMEDHDGWQDVLENITEALFPQQYGGILAANDDITPQQEDTMMRAEDRTETQIMTEFIARFAFLNGITSEMIAKRMEENE